jgi:hypothetical protein
MSTTKSSTDEEVDGAPEKATHIVDGDNDAEEPRVRMMESVEEIRVCDQTTKDALIPTETAQTQSAIAGRHQMAQALKRTVQRPTGKYK